MEAAYGKACTARSMCLSPSKLHCAVNCLPPVLGSKVGRFLAAVDRGSVLPGADRACSWLCQLASHGLGRRVEVHPGAVQCSAVTSNIWHASLCCPVKSPASPQQLACAKAHAPSPTVLCSCTGCREEPGHCAAGGGGCSARAASAPGSFTGSAPEAAPARPCHSSPPVRYDTVMMGLCTRQALAWDAGLSNWM